jgi:hypothetical protein
MVHRIFEEDYSGELIEGVFFDLIIPLDQPDLPLGYPPDERPPGTVANCHRREYVVETFVYGTVHFDRHAAYGCPINASHETRADTLRSPPFISRGRRTNHWIELFGGADLSKFVCDLSSTTVVVNSEFKNEISRSPLAGLSMARLPAPQAFNQSRISPELFFFDQNGPELHRELTVIAPTPNECPFCGCGPVVCPTCKHVEWDCPRCKNRLIVPEADHRGPGDLRFTVPPGPERGRVIEGEKWDGVDAFAGSNQAFVTGRFVEFALRCDAKPFVAQPCLVDVSRCGTKQIARLEAARFSA